MFLMLVVNDKKKNPFKKILTPSWLKKNVLPGHVNRVFAPAHSAAERSSTVVTGNIFIHHGDFIQYTFCCA